MSVIVLNKKEILIPGKNAKGDFVDGIIRNTDYRFPIWDNLNKSKMRNPFNHNQEWKGRG